VYSHVLHDWDVPRVERLLAASFAALPPGGWLIDHDTHVDVDKRGPLAVAEYSVLLMVDAGHAGFVDVEHRPTAGDRGVLLARKPGGS
jgi:hypothetical protein